MKFIKFGSLDELDFLSARIFRTAYGYRMVRIPSRVFTMTPWTFVLPDRESKEFEKSAKEQTKALAYCMEAWANPNNNDEGLPIFASYARMLHRLAGNAKRRDLGRDKSYTLEE